MILSFFWLVIAIVVPVIFEFLAEHLVAFFDLTLTSRTTFALIVSPFFAGGFPTFELPCHRVEFVTFSILARQLSDRKIGT